VNWKGESIMVNALRYQEPEVISPTRILLIDGDADFRASMTAVALSNGILLDAFESVSDFASRGKREDYRVVIVDYQLKATTGIKMAKTIQSLLLNETPVVLASWMHRGAILESNWPQTIASYLNKRFSLVLNF
jgi:DNA-binding NtrC family response regulator